MRTRLTADWVVGHENGRDCLIVQGEVICQDKHIIFVGHDFPGEVDVTYACGKALIAPGLIDLDALADLDTTSLGFDNQPDWRKGRVWPQSYVDRGPYEVYTQEELSSRSAMPSLSFCAMVLQRRFRSRHCSIASGARRRRNS